MARCSICSEMFVASDYETVCPECVDMGEGANVQDDYADYDDGQPDELQENQDFAHDDDFYNREEVEDQYLDGSWEDAHERGCDFDFGGDY